MSANIERRAAPSLLGPRTAPPVADARGATTLLDLLHEGFYALFMIKNGAVPPSHDILMERVAEMLAEFTRQARSMRADEADIEQAKYAYCATFDEIMLNCRFTLREQWQRQPSQLMLFGDQMAGEHFFERLELLRNQGRLHLQALQVFHMCLLLGFHGKYGTDTEKLNYLSGRLGDEIAHIKGRSGGFAPRAGRPDQVVNRQHGELPLWALSTLFALIALCAYLGLRASLTRATAATLAPYTDLIKLAPRPAHLTITLP